MTEVKRAKLDYRVDVSVRGETGRERHMRLREYVQSEFPGFAVAISSEAAEDISQRGVHSFTPETPYTFHVEITRGTCETETGCLGDIGLDSAELTSMTEADVHEWVRRRHSTWVLKVEARARHLQAEEKQDT